MMIGCLIKNGVSNHKAFHFGETVVVTLYCSDFMSDKEYRNKENFCTYQPQKKNGINLIPGLDLFSGLKC